MHSGQIAGQRLKLPLHVLLPWNIEPSQDPMTQNPFPIPVPTEKPQILN